MTDCVVRIPNPKLPEPGDEFLDSFGGRRVIVSVTDQWVISRLVNDEEGEEYCTSRHGVGYWRPAPTAAPARWQLKPALPGARTHYLYDGDLVIAVIPGPYVAEAAELIGTANFGPW